MKLYFHLFGITIPSYGLMIVLGVILANLFALVLLKKYHQDFYDFLILEAYIFLGGFLGAKLLYLLVSVREIEWKQITSFDSFNQLMQGGFVFYGGLIGGLAAALTAGKLHKIDAASYMKNFIALIPFIHSFGRIGCHMAGCCYGIPYSGIGAIQFPQGSLAPSQVSLFPVQLTEAAALMLLFLILITLQLKYTFPYTVELYLGVYGILRFLLEYFRYDEARGIFLFLTTSQWISLAFLAVSAGILFYKKRNAH